MEMWHTLIDNLRFRYAEFRENYAQRYDYAPLDLINQFRRLLPAPK
jgi:hypothetical protein